MLAVSHVGHTELSELVVQETTLIFPKITNAIDNTCNIQETQIKSMLKYIYIWWIQREELIRYICNMHAPQLHALTYISFTIN